MSKRHLGPVILDIKGLALDDDEAHLLRQPTVGGLILFARNYQDRHQLTALVRQVRALRPDLLIAVDQEGGRVQRFRKGFTRIPPMQVLGGLCRDERDSGLAVSRDCGWLMAVELISLDIDISFAPVLDLDERYSSIIGDRSFSPDPETVVAAARAFMEGMHEAGMATTGKHFPGHGGVRADSHLELPVDYRALKEVVERDLRPFEALRQQLDAVMPAHILFPNIDAQPVGYSEYWLQQILRRDLAFDGVIFSDDLSMAGAASAGGFLERADLALQAGCDAILVCNSPDDAAAVVAHLEPRRPTSPRLSKMRSRATVAAAADALASERRRATRDKLTGLWTGYERT